MLALRKIVVSDFRNIAFQELVFSPNINCIAGNNGEGKTNLLDAIWYLSMTKSAFATSDRYNFRHGSQEFSMCGTYSMPTGLESKVAVRVNSKGKMVRKDDKPYQRLSEHIGMIPVVMVSPADISLVSESGEERRRFVNAVLSQMSPEYLSSLQQYNRLLLQRNKLLKDLSPDAGLLDVLDMRMAAAAEPIYEAREKFVERLSPVVADHYRAVSGGGESVSVSYSSDCLRGSLADQLAASRERDLILHYTLAGPHRDDFLFEMDSHPIRRCGSQGQQKSFLVALKFAQYDIMKASYGFPPILLLDDVFDKLDMDRISNLIRMVAGNDFGQIFITDTNRERMQSVVDGITRERRYFNTQGGVFDAVP